MNKKTLIIAIAAIILLVAAAYVATLFINFAPGAKQDVSHKFKMDPRLPSGNADLVGSLVERRDNSLMVIPAASKDLPRQEAPQVEIVITSDTQLFADSTKDYLPLNPDPKVVYQQQLSPMTITEVGPGDTIAAYGELRGTRLVATFVLVNR